MSHFLIILFDFLTFRLRTLLICLWRIWVLFSMVTKYSRFLPVEEFTKVRPILVFNAIIVEAIFLRWFAYVLCYKDRRTWPYTPGFCFECRRTSQRTLRYRTELAIQVSLKMYLKLKQNASDKSIIFLIKIMNCICVEILSFNRCLWYLKLSQFTWSSLFWSLILYIVGRCVV